MQRIVTILDTALTVNYNDRPISTQKELDTYKFEFDDTWLGYVKTAVFYTDPAMVKHLLIPEDGIVTIPWEILTGKPQVLYIGVFGAKDSIIKPTTFGAVRLREGSYVDGIAPLPPTPDVYQQIISAWEGAKTDETIRVENENSRRNNFDALVIEYNALKVALQKEITDGTASVDALQVLETEYANKALALETTYAPRLGSVESQLAETMNKTAITLNHIFADNMARDSYFITNPLEKINLTFIKVGTAYQQLINGVWTAANPVIAEVVTAGNQPFTPVGGISATNTQAAIAELDTKKANKVQEPWITPTLLNGWTHSVSGGTIGVRYRKDGLGRVFMKGKAIPGVINLVMFNLPVGYRPLTNVEIFQGGNSSKYCWGYISLNGDVVMWTIPTQWLSLENISFTTD